MATVELEVDDVQEFIIQKVSDDDADIEEFAQEVFDSGLWQLYQQWKSIQDEDVQLDAPE